MYRQRTEKLITAVVMNSSINGAGNLAGGESLSVGGHVPPPPGTATRKTAVLYYLLLELFSVAVLSPVIRAMIHTFSESHFRSFVVTISVHRARVVRD